MQRYFIDTNDGDHPCRDEDGYEVPDAEAARRMALDALPDMARERLPDGDRWTFTARVRDAGGRVIYTAELNLKGEWHTPTTGP